MFRKFEAVVVNIWNGICSIHLSYRHIYPTSPLKLYFYFYFFNKYINKIKKGIICTSSKSCGICRMKSLSQRLSTTHLFGTTYTHSLTHFIKSYIHLPFLFHHIPPCPFYLFLIYMSINKKITNNYDYVNYCKKLLDKNFRRFISITDDV